jgi:uncharacterized membrane protein
MRLSTILTAAALALAGCSEPEPQRPAGPPRPPSKVEPGVAGDPVRLGGVDLRGDIDARGTEPFWAVEIRADGLRLTGVDLAERTAPNRGVRLRGPTASWTSETAEGQRFSVILADGRCSDGMSDRIYPLSAMVQVGDTRRVGCAGSTEALLSPEEQAASAAAQ